MESFSIVNTGNPILYKVLCHYNSLKLHTIICLWCKFCWKISFKVPFQSRIIPPPPLEPKLPLQESSTFSFSQLLVGFSHLNYRGTLVFTATILTWSSSIISCTFVSVLSHIPSITAPNQCHTDSHIVSPLSFFSSILTLHRCSHSLHKIIVGSKPIYGWKC